MTGFLGRLAIASTVVSIPLAAAAVATSAVTVAAPGVSSPQCDPTVYTHCAGRPRPVRPAYAPPYAPVDVPPPPPPPPWAQQLQPRWDEGSQQWVWVRI